MYFEDQQQCQLLKSLADENRLRIIRLLSREELNVQELCDILAIPQPSVSRHLAHLKKAGIVRDRRDGAKVYYSQAELDKEKLPLSHYIECISSSDHPDLERLEICLNKRALENAGEKELWGEAVSKLYHPSSALPALAQLSPRGLTVADLGTGTGMMLPILSQFAETVYAVDHSRDMLKSAEKRCKELNLSNIRFIHSALDNLQEVIPPCDATLLHFVIHQIPNPGILLKDIAQSLKPGGRLVIIDRLKHNDDSARKQFGSVWLGFEESQLQEWLNAAGFKNFYWQLCDISDTTGPVFAASAQI